MSNVINLADVRRDKLITALKQTVSNNLNYIADSLYQHYATLPGYQLYNYLMTPEHFEEGALTHTNALMVDIVSFTKEELIISLSSFISSKDLSFYSVNEEEQRQRTFIHIHSRRITKVVPIVTSMKMSEDEERIVERMKLITEQCSAINWPYADYLSRVISYVLLYSRFTIEHIDSESMLLTIWPFNSEDEITIEINTRVLEYDKPFLIN